MKKPLALVALSSLAVAMAILSTSDSPVHNSNGSTDRNPLSRESMVKGLGFDPNKAPYPSDWQMPLSQVETLAAFPVLVPSAQTANQANVTAVYLWPNRMAVALDFPAPAVPDYPTRQNYIEVYESLWGGSDPLSDFQADMAQNPVQGKAIYDLGGIPALGVAAHSTGDANGSNPAFLRFVFRGVEIQVSGGESLETLIGIAKTIIAV
jgi:hypothetical protein